jgi:hypothetical protein
MRVAMVVLVVSLQSYGQSNNRGLGCSGQTCVDAIVAALEQRRVDRVEILRVPLNLETRAAITPEALEQIYYTKLVIRNISTTSLHQRLIESLKATSVQLRGYIPDLRVGLIFYSREGAKLGAIYFDKSWHVGAINESGISFHGDSFRWLESYYSQCSIN